MPSTIQINFGKRHGKRAAQYRVQNVDGSWPKVWHHMTVADADKAVAAGTFDMGGALGVVTVEVRK